MEIGVLLLESEVAKLGEKHPQVAKTLNELAIATGNMHLPNYSTVKEMLERALRIEEKCYGPEDREVAGTLMNLGPAYTYLGDYKDVEDCLRRALAIETKYGMPERRVAIIYANLSFLY